MRQDCERCGEYAECKDGICNDCLLEDNGDETTEKREGEEEEAEEAETSSSSRSSWKATQIKAGLQA